MGGYLAAAYATNLLQAMGATVTKVEPVVGDAFRADPKNFVAVNAGKTSVPLDLTTDQGRADLMRIIQESDVVVQNLSRSSVRKMRIGYEEYRGWNPEIVVASIQSFGDGPYQEHLATNPIIEALVGVMGTDPDGKPVRQAIPVFDQMAGSLAALGAMAMLAGIRAGEPIDERHYVVPLFETAAFMLNARLAEAQLRGSEAPGPIMATAPYGVFRARDDQWIFLGVINDQQWQRFIEKMGLREAADDPRYVSSTLRADNRESLDALVQGRLREFDAETICSELQAVRVPVSLVRETKDLLHDQHLRKAGGFERILFDGQTLELARCPLDSDAPDGPPTAKTVPSLHSV